MGIQQGTREFKHSSLALFAGGFSTFALLYCLQPIIPELTLDFNITPTLASLAMSVTTIAMALTMLFVGALSDAWGRKTIMTASLAAASVITVAFSFSTSFNMLLLLRIVQGIVLAGLPAIAMTYLSEEMDKNSLGYAMGLYISGNAIGGMAGRIISGLLTDWFNWRVATTVLGSLSILASIVFWLTIPASRNFVKRKLELSKLVPLLWTQLVNVRLLCLYGLGFLFMGGFVTLFNYIGFELLGAPYNLSQSLVGSIFVVYIMGSISSTWMGRMADRYGRIPIMLAALGIFLSGALLTGCGSLVFKILGITLFVFGFFGGHSIASSWVGLVSKEHKSQANSLYLFFYYVGSSLSGTGGGLLYHEFGWSGIIGLIAVYVVIGVLLCGVLKRLGAGDNSISTLSG
ncbi:MFS transporter [Paenibacillus agri]|uniref:MFS transporter n=1 Tax=Paenibacillus agri TaxID=2744309 RepID=A0A850ELR1_9BACL|nr:MFS transporter [Paenibacillus agri]NUU60669.1 MFS transporter [Paenibacillus agri]